MTTVAAQGPHGPFESEAQVLALPDVQAVFEAAHASNRHGVLREGSEAILLSACADVGVELGDYDASMARWLADFGPKACAVFAALISRAAHGKPGPHAVTFDLLEGNALHVLTGALTAFRAEQGERAARSGDPSLRAWADEATIMLDLVNAALPEPEAGR